MLPEWMNLLKYSVSGIKCDTPNCDYRDMSIQRKEYKAWVNKPCPKCGGNILTEGDYKLTVNMHRITTILNIVLMPIHIFRYATSHKYRELTKLRFVMKGSMDGTGSIKFTAPELKV